MTIAPEAPTRPAVPKFLELEITGKCQLTCPSLCYAKAGPTGGHGSMTTDDWKQLITEAAAIGVRKVQFIGGEPTMHPDFSHLVHHALASGLDVQVYSNLYRVKPEHWELFEHPKVSLATSYYSDVAEEHERVTGRKGSHAATRANIVQALQRGVPLQVGIVEVFEGQRTAQAREELLDLGVRTVNVDRVRSVGRGQVHVPSTKDLCGRCADGRAAIMTDGTVTPCVLGRFLQTGNAKTDGLAAVFNGKRWADTAASIPRRSAPTAGCTPADSNDCDPANTEACDPAYQDERSRGTMKWLPHARRLAHQVVRPESRWHDAVARVPRHQFVPRWWEQEGHGWVLRTGPDDPDAWLEAAYSDQSLVTQVDTHHADRADTDDVLAGGTPTSSSTLPSLVVRMYRHAMIGDGHQLLVTTGTGYGTALACARLGEEHVTSIDIDEYLVKLAADRLALLGERPRMEVCDITGPLPGEYDRIVATVSVRPVPVSWLKALRTGGRFVTTISGTGLILTADKTADGGAVGRIEWDRAGFMPTRHGDSYDSPVDDIWKGAAQDEGEEIFTSRYPLLYPPDAWDVMSMLELQLPGIQYRKTQDGDTRTVWLLCPDGSWARATATGFLESPVVHQSGPRRLWSDLERIRNRLNREGALPVYGARVTITPDGTTTLTRGAWKATL